jgi:hypothetical protein
VYYVAVSRARYEAEIFTDDGKRLPAAVSREADKTAALEISQLQRHAEKTRANNGPEYASPRTQGRERSGPEFSIGG